MTTTDGIQQATHAPLELLQNNDVPVEMTLELNDPTGGPVPNWDDVTVELICETPLGTLLLSTLTGEITKVDQDPVDTGQTVIVAMFAAGRLAVPTNGSYVTDVIDPDVAVGRLTYRWGPFRVRRTRRDGTATGWTPVGILFLVSPDGTQWELKVDNAGVVTTEPV